MKKILLLIFSCVIPLWAGTNVTCNNNSGDAALIQTSLNGGGTTTLNGTCAIGTTILQTAANSTLLLAGAGGATINYTGLDHALYINHNSVVVQGIVFNGGGVLTTQNSYSTPQTFVNITLNTFQNIPSGNSGIDGNGLWSHFTITNNKFINITSVPFATSWVSGVTIPENDGTSRCAAFNNGNCEGAAIANSQGMDNTIIEFNQIDYILSSAISTKFNWLLGAQGGGYKAADHNSISYNTFTHLARMAIEPGGGGSGCPGGCNFANWSYITQLKMAGNYGYNWLQPPYWQTFGISANFAGAVAPQFINNTFVSSTTGGPAYAFELGNHNEVFQGNVVSVNSGAGNWGGYNVSVYPGVGYSNFQQNNLFEGPVPNPGGCAPAPGGCYFSYGDGAPNYGGTFVTQYNYLTPNCDTPSNCAVSNLQVGSSAVTQSGGNFTMNMYAIDQVSVRYILYYLDGSGTPLQSAEELQDLSTTFSSDRKWLYHITYTLSGLSNGLHTITGTATDVTGATKSTTQSFTVGGGTFPGAVLSPTTLTYGASPVGTATGTLNSTLNNSGGAVLNISSIVLGGTNSGDFTLSGGTCGATLAIGATCQIGAFFTPSAIGTRTATITVTDNASPTTQVLSLTGVGGNVPCAGGILTNCNFGTGSQSPWFFNGGSWSSIAIDSTGSCGVLSAHISASGSVPSGSNTELGQDNLTLAANGATYNVSFDASTNRAQSINMLGILQTSPFTTFLTPNYPPTITTGCHSYTTTMTTVNSPSAGNVRVVFQANSLQNGDRLDITNVKIQQASTTPGASFAPGALNFGAIGWGNSAPLGVTLSNPGSAPLNITNFTFTGANAGDFNQTNTCGATLAAGASCSITVNFVPTALGARTGTLNLNSNAPGSPTTATLSGTSTEVGNIDFPYFDHGSFAVIFSTHSNSIGSRVRYIASPGDCTSGTGGTLQSNQQPGILAAFAQYSVGGLGFGSYMACPEVTKDGTTWSTGAGKVVTLPPFPVSPIIHPIPPIEPLDFPTDYPDTTGYSTFTVAADCSDFGTQYQNALANWALSTPKGSIIAVPAGTVCTYANYSYEPTPPDVFMWTASNFTLSTGTFTINSHGMSEGDLVSFGRPYTSNIYPAGNNCDVGFGSILPGGIQSGQRYPVHVIDGNNFQIRCLPQAWNFDQTGPVPTPSLMTFAAVPSGTLQLVPWHQTTYKGKLTWTRNIPWIIVRSAAPDSSLPPVHSQITPQFAPNMAVFVDPVGNISNNTGCAACSFWTLGDIDPNIERPVGGFWFGPGLEFTTANYNASVHSSDPRFFNYVIRTYPWDGQIVFDRVYYHMLGAPNRENVGFYWNGSNMSITDSYFDNLTYYHATNSGFVVAKTGSNTFSVGAGIANAGFGPINTLASSGMTVAISGSGTGRMFVYYNLLSGNALTIGAPSGVTAACTGAVCAVGATATSTDGSCIASDGWPQTSAGEPTVAQIACVDIASGVISAVTTARPEYSRWNGEGDSHMLAGIGPGPYKIINTHTEGAGITRHFDDGAGVAYRGNYRLFRDYLYSPLKYMHGSPVSDGLFYFHRQPLEWKAGQFISLIGNIFDTTWREQTPDGTFLAFTPVTGGWTSDVLLRSNIFRHGGGVIEGINTTCSSNSLTSNGNEPCARPAARYSFRNNLVYDINGYVYSAFSPYGSNGPGLGWNFQIYGVEDWVVDHNTFQVNRGGVPYLFSLDGPFVEGVQWTNNLLWYTGVNGQFPYAIAPVNSIPPSGCGALGDAAYMNCALTRGIGITNYNFSQNVLAGGWSNSSVPSGQASSATMSANFSGLTNSYFTSGGTVPATALALKWTNPTIDNILFDYNLRSDSPYKAGAGNWGYPLPRMGDEGIDPVQFAKDQNKVTLVGSTVTSTTGTVQYTVGDISGACSAAMTLLSGDPNIINPSKGFQGDGGPTTPGRSVTFTGLTLGALYGFRVYCSGNADTSQVQGVLRPQ